MASGRILQTLLSGMWHGYRRWMTLFNATSIVLSVCLAVVILSFAHGVRAYVADMVRKEAAAGAVRIHLSGWQPMVVEGAFRDRVREADAALRRSLSESEYEGSHVWWRSEAHFLSLRHPADEEGRGIFASLGNTTPDDPEAERVRPYAVAGGWVGAPDAEEIVLSAEAALKLSQRLPGSSQIGDLVGRTIWIVLPGTQDHTPAACAEVRVTGVFRHMRDQACMTTPGAIQQMFARTRANANGRWYETYDRLGYTIQSIQTDDDAVHADPSGPAIPLLCWRVREYTDSWVHLGGDVSAWAESGDVRAVRLQAHTQRRLADEAKSGVRGFQDELEDVLLRLSSRDQNRQWLDELSALGEPAFAEAGDTGAVQLVHERLEAAARNLDVDLDVAGVTNRTAFLAAHTGLTNTIAERENQFEARGALLRASIPEELAALAAAEAEFARLNAEADALASHQGASRDAPLQINVKLNATDDILAFAAPHRNDLPPSLTMNRSDLDVRYPEGYVLCSPRVWEDLGYRSAPLLDVEPWQDSALYAYFYFRSLETANRARVLLRERGFDTYMPIDKFRGLVSMVQLITWGATALLAAVLFSGLLGIAITLYTEVDAEEREIGLLKALGASNGLIGSVFLFKGGLIGLLGVAAGIPLAWAIGMRIDRLVSDAVAESVGLTDVQQGFFSREPWMVVVVACSVVALAALAALMPALQAARKDPQDALRAE